MLADGFTMVYGKVKQAELVHKLGLSSDGGEWHHLLGESFKMEVLVFVTPGEG